MVDDLRGREMKKATLTIEIWAEEKGADLPIDSVDLPYTLAPHIQHIEGLCDGGGTEGEVIGDGFKGWWKITEID